MRESPHEYWIGERGRESNVQPTEFSISEPQINDFSGFPNDLALMNAYLGKVATWCVTHFRRSSFFFETIHAS